MTSFVSATVGSAGATVLGRSVVAGVMKLIPGIGTAAGGLISGTTAGLITTALGEAYIRIMEKVFLGEIKKEELLSTRTHEVMVELFREELKKK